MATIGHYISKSLTMSPHKTARKAVEFVSRKIKNGIHRNRDLKLGTFSELILSGGMYNYFRPVPLSSLEQHQDCLSSLSQLYLTHRFDLLGSGWVQVKHGMSCRGLEGFTYEMSKAIDVDKEGKWLRGRINESNLAESQKIWRLVAGKYVPIDWQLDFKSGFRWAEGTWHQDIAFGNKLGADIKVPWELARMQHLPQLAWMYALSSGGREGFEIADAYVQEFRNEVLDFRAGNPPRFGVNWACTMDVAIRAANWLVAYDLFRAYGVEFDDAFETEFKKSIYEHGLHIINHLEWKPEFHGNHYLSDIAGLLFIAAYLPRNAETDAWLAFAVQELIDEVSYQFNADGTNFESSTCYHRLSAEIALYATVLVLGLRSDKQKALQEYHHNLLRVNPKLKPAPLTLFPSSDTNRSTPFPSWYIERMEKMAEFTMSVSKPDGTMPQIGDNDSGQFFKLNPVFRQMSVAQAKARYENLKGYDHLPDTSEYWKEEHLDHRCLVAVADGLFRRDDFAEFSRDHFLATDITRRLTNDMHITSSRQHSKTDAGGFKVFPFLDFGLYIYRSDHFYAAVRCGSIGQKGYGGHAHSDQLSFVLSVDGISMIIDPGTYLYTPLPEQRNRFRSPYMHNCLAVEDKDRNRWPEGEQGLFMMFDKDQAEVVELNNNSFTGEYSGYGIFHRRTLELSAERFSGIDEYRGRSGKKLIFHLAPGLAVSLDEEGKTCDLTGKDVHVRFQVDSCMGVTESDFSPGYGILQKNKVLRVETSGDRVHWSFQILEKK